MSLWDDYKAEAQFAYDFPFGVPNEYWHSKEGAILITDMTEQHIRNCMKMVGEDDDWYPYFQKELHRREQMKKHLCGDCDRFTPVNEFDGECTKHGFTYCMSFSNCKDFRMGGKGND